MYANKRNAKITITQASQLTLEPHTLKLEKQLQYEKWNNR